MCGNHELDLSRGLERVPVKLTNRTSDELMEKPYIVGLVGKSGTSLAPLAYAQGCACPGSKCDRNTCACVRKWGGTQPGYSVLTDDKDALDSGEWMGLSDVHGDGTKFLLIYECGSACGCNENCGNRLVQHGVNIALEVYMTERKGWGVRALAPIRTGQFVCEYAGEVINTRESKRRQSEMYDPFGLNYLLSVTENIVERVGDHLSVSEAFIEGLDGQEGAERDGTSQNKLVDNSGSMPQSVPLLKRARVSEIEANVCVQEKKIRPDTDTSPALTQTNAPIAHPGTTSSLSFVSGTNTHLCDVAPKSDGSDEHSEYSSNTEVKYTRHHPQEAQTSGKKGAQSPRRIASPQHSSYRTNIDATMMGNVGRYVNHSCDPNLTKQIARHGLPLPSVALFANRDIQVGEELTFTYGDVIHEQPCKGTYVEREAHSRAHSTTDKANGTRIVTQCKCGAVVCTGFMPFQAD